MKTVVGLFWSDEDVQNSLHLLENAGFARDGIGTARHISRQRLAGDLGHPVTRCVGCGAIIGIAIFGTFGLAAAVTGCNCLAYDLTYGAATLVGFIVVGSLVGTLLALWIGIDALERDTHLFVQGVNWGGKLVTVQTPDEHTTKAMAVLRDSNSVAVAMLAG